MKFFDYRFLAKWAIFGCTKEFCVDVEGRKET